MSGKSERRKRREVPRYVDKVVASLANRQLPTGVHKVLIFHDDWCAIFRGSQCNCNPDVEMPEIPGRN